MTDTATAPLEAPFETHVYVNNHRIAHMSMRTWLQDHTWRGEDVGAIALNILEAHMAQQTWGARSPVTIRTCIEIIMVLDENGDSVTQTKVVRKAAEQVLSSLHYPPVRRNLLFEGLLASSSRDEALNYQLKLGRPLTQPDLVSYLAGYFAQFIKDEERRVAHELYEHERATA